MAYRIRQLKDAEGEAATALPALSPAVAGFDNPFAFRPRLLGRGIETPGKPWEWPRGRPPPTYKDEEWPESRNFRAFLGRAVLGSSKVTVYKSLLSLDNLVQDVSPVVKRTQDEADLLAPILVALNTEKVFKVEDADGVLCERGFLYFRPGFCPDRVYINFTGPRSAPSANTQSPERVSTSFSRVVLNRCYKWLDIHFKDQVTYSRCYS